MSETWTIGELAEHAAEALGSDGRLNGRVREVPNERLIRWYVTIGLLDPPLARRGRVAVYGQRHLLQLISVKRLQAAGHSIAEIQIKLAGAPDSTLQTIARSSPYPTDPEPFVPEPARPRFWASPPPDPPAEEPHAVRIHGVKIAPGVALVLDGAGRAPSDADLAAIAAAAGPLLAALTQLGLIVTNSEGTPL